MLDRAWFSRLLGHTDRVTDRMLYQYVHRTDVITTKNFHSNIIF